MRIVKVGNSLNEVKATCNHCQSELAYVKQDIKTFWYPWERTGTESSRQSGYEYIECPICYNHIKLKKLLHDF